jgi:hypothetical protein
MVIPNTIIQQLTNKNDVYDARCGMWDEQQQATSIILYNSTWQLGRTQPSPVPIQRIFTPSGSEKENPI